MNPLSRLLQDNLPAIDVGVMSHGFAAHGRDYIFIIENSFGPRPGTYRLTFTHVVDFKYGTAISDNVWQRSWSDEFTNYANWETAGEPDGYVFGNNWSLAYPGLNAVENDSAASSWSMRLNRPMYAATIATDRFKIELIFHDVHLEWISDDTAVVSQTIVPMPAQGAN